MSLDSDFQQRLEKKSDQELLAVLAHPQDYLPEALAAIQLELARRNVDAAQSPREPAPPLSPEALPKLPRPWVGFVFAGAFLVAEFLDGGRAKGLGFFALVVTVASWLDWLFCVSRFHAVVNALALPDPESPSGTTYPVSASTAVGRHFIPFYNFYWGCVWPVEMERYLKAHFSIQMLSGAALGVGLLLSLLLRVLVDGFLSFTLLFGLGAYIAAKLRQAVREHLDRDKVPEIFA
jgi:hypothetical protein